MHIQMLDLLTFGRNAGGIDKIAVKIPGGNKAGPGPIPEGFEAIMNALLALPEETLQRSFNRLQQIPLEGCDDQLVPMLDLTGADTSDFQMVVQLLESAGQGGIVPPALNPAQETTIASAIPSDIPVAAEATGGKDLTAIQAEAKNQSTTISPFPGIPAAGTGGSAGPFLGGNPGSTPGTNEIPKEPAHKAPQFLDDPTVRPGTASSNATADAEAASGARRASRKTATPFLQNTGRHDRGLTNDPAPGVLSGRDRTSESAMLLKAGAAGREAESRSARPWVASPSGEPASVAPQPASPSQNVESRHAKALEGETSQAGSSSHRAISAEIAPIEAAGESHADADRQGGTMQRSTLPEALVKHAVSAASAGSETETRQAAGTPRDTATDIMRQIVERMTMRSDRLQSHMQIRLKPEFLGDVRMQISTENHQVMVRISAETQAVKEMIEQHVISLKNELQQHGLQIDKFDVFVGHDNGTFRQKRQHYPEGNRTNARSSQSLEDDRGRVGSTGKDAGRPSVRSNDGAVDFFA